MTETVCVLALDAADERLAREWDCQNILLDEHGELETFAYSKDEPYTPEVWATVATGVGPETHGIGAEAQGQEWDNPLLRAASRVTEHLPSKARRKLGRPFRALGATHTMQRVADGVDHPFDATLSWPGIDGADHLQEAWRVGAEVEAGTMSQAEYDRIIRSLTGREVGWLAAMADTDLALVGTHAHVLDITGHIHCRDEAALREWYEWVDGQVGRLRERADRLLVLSDHGMQVSWLGDDDPGGHSWRALAASQGLGGALPGDVFGVRECLESWADAAAEGAPTVEMDTETEQLEALGYI
jgi:hypothetical protein